MKREEIEKMSTKKLIYLIDIFKNNNIKIYRR
jgi:hypothetical protein